MPELQHPRLYTPALVSKVEGQEPSPFRMVELHCKSNFSFLEGASHPDELVTTAAQLGYAGIAITDRNTLSGVVRAHIAAKKVGLKLIVGAEITPADSPPALLWATNRHGYGRLCRLLTRGRMQAPKGECHFTFADVAEHADGLLAGVLLPHSADPKTQLQRWAEAFPGRTYAVAELHRGSSDARQLEAWQLAAREAKVPLVAGGDVHYHDATRRYLQDVLTAIRLKTTVAELGAVRFPNAERRLRSLDEQHSLFARCPEAIERTVEIADGCNFSLDELKYDYPIEVCPEGETPSDHLARLTYLGAAKRYPKGVPEKVLRLLEHELAIIRDMNYAAYFLTVWDLVRFARSRGILCQGRGSAANSAVCFCLEVTSVDPDIIDVLFERFISRERNEAPDIDVDFEHQRREEVIQYVYDKYGRERSGMTAELITYRPRSAIRDVGKALGLSLDRVDALAKTIGHYADTVDEMVARFHEAGMDPTTRVGRQLIHLVRQILGFPRHLSQHVGGMVLSQPPLCELVPIENASMPGRTVLQWDKDDLDALCILKVDCLALGMLSAIRRAFDLIEQHENQTFTLASIPEDDPATYAMIQLADTIGVFQIESRAQMSMLPRLKPAKFYDLVIEVAIVRPGPIQGDMVHPYLRRRSGLEKVEYPKEEVRKVLEKTLGVPLFQEQAMKLVIVAAKFEAGEADQLRRAMAAWRRNGMIEQFEGKLIEGMLANGYTEEFAKSLFRQLEGFGSYGFPESHAVSFAHLAYVSAWIKCHHPAAFLAALLNSQPMGFYSPSQLVSDARAHGVEVRPVDINQSEWDSTLERSETDGKLAVRLGWSRIKGMPEAAANILVQARQTGPFTSYNDLVSRTGFGSGVLGRLAAADVFAPFGLSRRPAIWQAIEPIDSTPLFFNLPDEPPPPLPLLSPAQEVVQDYHSQGLSLRGHPFEPFRAFLTQQRVVAAVELAHLEPEKLYRVAGLVLLRQRPGTAKGVTFMTLEDETGTVNLIVWKHVWERYHRVARRARALVAHGLLQRQEGVIHIIVRSMKDLTTLVSNVSQSSRDFH